MIMLIGWCLCLAGCGGSSGGDDDSSSGCDCDQEPTIEESGLTLSLANQEEKLPANVSVIFKVETETEVPITELEVTNVGILEDGFLISEDESKKALLPKPGKFKSYTLLLLDLSGSVLESEKLSTLRGGAREFVKAVMPPFGSDEFGEIEIGIWWFDGAADIHPLVPFVTDIDELISGIETIDKDISNDSSTNLYGAVIQGIDNVKSLTGKEKSIVSVASVVIFTDGDDQAGWRSEEDALKAVGNAAEAISIYSIGLGDEINESILKAFGRDDFVFADDIDDLVEQFEKIAGNIRKDVRSYYLLEYCSPKRKGSHDLKISVNYNGLNGSGSSEKRDKSFLAPN